MNKSGGASTWHKYFKYLQILGSARPPDKKRQKTLAQVDHDDAARIIVGAKLTRRGRSGHHRSDGSFAVFLALQFAQHNETQAQIALHLLAPCWVAQSRAYWCDIPADYGQWHTIYIRFGRWCDEGRWEPVIGALEGQPEMRDALRGLERG